MAHPPRRAQGRAEGSAQGRAEGRALGSAREKPAGNERKRALPLAATTRWTPDLLRGVAEGEGRVLGAILARGTPGAAADAAAEASRRAAALVESELARDPPSAPIACADGCSACCFSKIVAVAPEVLRIAAHLRSALAPGALAALVDRVRDTDARTRGLGRDERAAARVPCPLLQDGSCSVHAIRPLVCRGWTSFDRAACERHFEAPDREPVPPGHAISHELANAVLAGLGKACLDAGLDGHPLELVAALRIALERPNAEERWLARLPVFSRARDAEPRGAGDPDDP